MRVVFPFLCLMAFSAHAFDAIQNIVEQDRIKYKLPALSVSVQVPGEEEPRGYISGYNTLSGQQLITSDTLFRMGSITKTFTATLILQLVENKILTLGDTLEQWLPQYPRWKTITIRNLLTHTSGVYNYSHGEWFDNQLRKDPTKRWSPDELIAIAYRHNDIFRPGTQYAYTNTDYVLLGKVIEKATQKPLQEVFNEYFTAYHLGGIFYAPSGGDFPLLHKIAHGYNRDGTFVFNQEVTSVSFSHADGAIIAAPHAITNWLNKLFAGKIISKASLAEMTNIISEENKSINLQALQLEASILKQPIADIGAGLGMGLVHFKDYGFMWAHAGGMPGYESFYAVNPCTGISLVLAYNVKPKEQVVFAHIAQDIFAALLATPGINTAIENYRKENVVPEFCR